MIEFLLGAVAASALYTFFPTLAVVPSGWLRKAWQLIRPPAAPTAPDDSDRAGV